MCISGLIRTGPHKVRGGVWIWLDASMGSLLLNLPSIASLFLFCTLWQCNLKFDQSNSGSRCQPKSCAAVGIHYTAMITGPPMHCNGGSMLFAYRMSPELTGWLLAAAAIITLAEYLQACVIASIPALTGTQHSLSQRNLRSPFPTTLDALVLLIGAAVEKTPRGPPTLCFSLSPAPQCVTTVAPCSKYHCNYEQLAWTQLTQRKSCKASNSQNSKQLSSFADCQNSTLHNLT